MKATKYSKYYEKAADILALDPNIKNLTLARKLLNLDETHTSRNNKELRCLGKYLNDRGGIDKILNQGVISACNNVGVDPSTAPMMWLKTKEESVRVTNPLYKPKEAISYDKLHEDIIESVKTFAPKFHKQSYKKNKDSKCFVIDPADIHIGKLSQSFETGEDYNNQIAVQRVMEGVDGLLDKSSGFDIDQMVLIGGNDVLHIDSPLRKTTAGTPQDTDGMWHSNFLIAKKLYVDIIYKMLKVAPVHFVFNPSNHDYVHGFLLSQVIEAYFHKNKDVTFEVSPSHRKYYIYGNNIIGTSHGDGAKEADLPILMANECDKWTECSNRYMILHHKHHRIAKDYIGVTVEYMRSPSGTDSWHHRNGYQHAPKAIEGMLFDKNHGMIARLTHLF